MNAFTSPALSERFKGTSITPINKSGTALYRWFFGYSYPGGIIQDDALLSAEKVDAGDGIQLQIVDSSSIDTAEVVEGSHLLTLQIIADSILSDENFYRIPPAFPFPSERFDRVSITKLNDGKKSMNVWFFGYHPYATQIISIPSGLAFGIGKVGTVSNGRWGFIQNLN